MEGTDSMTMKRGFLRGVRSPTSLHVCLGLVAVCAVLSLALGSYCLCRMLVLEAELAKIRELHSIQYGDIQKEGVSSASGTYRDPVDGPSTVNSLEVRAGSQSALLNREKRSERKSRKRHGRSGGRLCVRCKRVCWCKNGKPRLGKLNGMKTIASYCTKCCEKPECIHVDPPRNDPPKQQPTTHPPSARNPTELPARPDARHLHVVADVQAYEESLGRGFKPPIVYPNGDNVTSTGRMFVAGNRISHGWVIDSYADRKVIDKYYDQIDIKQDGVYMVYAQVTFRYYLPHGKFELRMEYDYKMNTLSECAETDIKPPRVDIFKRNHNDSPIYHVTCTTTLVKKLKAGTKIRLECPGQCPFVVMKRDATFFGVALL